MYKLTRTALFAGLLAFGVAACGDDVTVVETPPAMSVQLTPGTVTVEIGETVNLGVNISGGDPEATPTWTCASSNTGVATAEASETGCQVTGVSRGTVTVTATVTRGNQTTSASSEVRVVEDAIAPASVSISAINQGPNDRGLPVGQPVDLDDVAGQVDAVLNVVPGDQTVTRVELVIAEEDGSSPRVVASQEIQITAATVAEQAAEEDDPAQQAAQQITLSANTAAWDLNEETGLGEPRFLNGPKQFRARIFVAEVEGPAARNIVAATFNNQDFAEVRFRDDLSGNTAVRDDVGVRYYGGDDLIFQAIPVSYDGLMVARVSMRGETDGGPASIDLGEGAGAVATLTEGPFQFVADYDDNYGEVEDDAGAGGHEFEITELRDENGVNITANFDLRGVGGLHLDLTPPSLAGAIEVMNNGDTQAPTGAPVDFFSSGFFTVPDATDAGVGVSEDLEAPPGTFRAILYGDDDDPIEGIQGIDDLDEAGTADPDTEGAYVVQIASFADKVGNAVDPDLFETDLADEGETEEFNVDKTAPEVEDVMPEESIIFRGLGDEPERSVLFSIFDPDLLDEEGEDAPGAGVDIDAVEILVENLTEEDDAELEGTASAAVEEDEGDWTLNVGPTGTNLGDGQYRVTVSAPDFAIVPNVSEDLVIEFVRVVTPPEVDLTHDPASTSTGAASVQRRIAGTLTAALEELGNAIDPETSMVTVFNNATCEDDPMDPDDGLIDRNEIEIGAEFDETFRLFNPDPNGPENEQQYCFLVEANDIAVDNEGEADPNIATVETVITIMWNPTGGAAPEADDMTAVEGDGETVVPGGTVDLVVLVEDQFGDPFEGHTVTFDITTDGSDDGTPAELSDEEVDTDASGEASTTLTAGNGEGSIEVTASADGVDDVVFTITVAN